MKLGCFDFSASVNRRIFHTILVVGLSSLLPKAAMVVRDLAIAGRFGTSDQVDAFLIALLVPSLMVQVVVSAFATSLIPVFIRLREQEGPASAADLSARAGSFGLFALIVLTGLLYLAGPWVMALVAPGFSAAKHALALEYYRWLVPLVLFQGGATIWTALLNASGRFALVTLLPSITPMLVFLVLASPLVDQGMAPVAAATLIGGMVEAALAGIMMYRQGLRLWQLSWGASLVEILRQALPMAGGMALVSGNLVIDQFFASLTGDGGIAMLTYGNKTVGFISAMISLPLGVAVLPYFSEQVAQKDWPGLRHSLRLWILLISIITVPITIVLLSFSEQIISILFERGQFQSGDTKMVALIQIAYTLQLPFYILGILFGRMMNSLGMNKWLLLTAAGSLLINAFLDYILLKAIGLPGIALSTGLVYALSSLAVYIKLHTQLKHKLDGANSVR